MPQTIILKNVELLSDCDELIQTDITISDDCITGIGTAMEAGDKTRVIDCTDKLAIPGLINTHTHAAMSLFRSYADDMLLMDWLENKIWPAEANLTAEDVYYGTLLAIAEMLKTGTTTFADMYFYMPQVAEAVAESGIRAVLARGMTGLGANALQSLAESEAFYHEYHHTANERITVMLGPHAPYTCPPDYLKKVVSLAQKLDAEIHIHLSETAGEVENCFKQYGKSPIELMSELGVLDCGVLAAHCVHVSTEDIQIMRQKQVRVAHNPGSNMKLASGIAPVPQMLAAGLCVGLGTDGAASNNNLDMLEEIRLTALLHKVNTRDPLVIPAQTAVKMATAFGAQALGLADKVGRLAPGLKADIVLLDMDSPHWCPRHNRLSLLAYSASAGDVHTVIANGKIVVENRRLTTIDEEKLLYEAHKRSMRLTGK
ncbi:amidohydrolase [Propionispora hippei]|uniref:5-methylthioadenosine/S-adenosylhomocysteine deaminase n=1 Tax=Propionispora hippei DSM 15287 TaxID=1123003 RepID=A0A1M6AVT0_9FIRM|nr:amidohydrolase [Propionispora hippei]SHI40585.1 5-methylthioadenosine/S-adenosylhomocysteine deaminase [Propionispora hippei DSM 15287]